MASRRPWRDARYSYDMTMPTIEIVPLRTAAEILKVSIRAAESALRNAAVRSGYPLAQVEWVRDHRPGQGARTDLDRPGHAAVLTLGDAAELVREAAAAITTATHDSTRGPGTRPYDRPVTVNDRTILDPRGWDSGWEDRDYTPACAGDAGIIEQAADEAVMALHALEAALNERIRHFAEISEDARMTQYDDHG